MYRWLPALCLLLLVGCGEAMPITVEISHQIRCSFVRLRGRWELELPEEQLAAEQCCNAFERVLREWEQQRQ